MSNSGRIGSVLLFAAIVAVVVAQPTLGQGERPDSVRARSLAGCWALSAEPFKATTKTGIDGDMTNLPMRVRLDTVPGSGMFGEARDWLLRAIPDTNRSRYKDGLYFPVGRDKAFLQWSNGYVWLSMNVTVKGAEMHGTAEAGTDYGGEMRAKVSLQRISCP